MSKLFFSPLAAQDLQEIKVYISAELAGSIAAKNILQKILKRLQRLQRYPRSGASLSAIVNTDYRYLVCENYIAFYRYDGKNIYIIRILYHKRDFLKTLFG